MSDATFYGQETARQFPPQPILTGGSDNFDDAPRQGRCCPQCFDEGFAAGAASVRKAPFITVDLSSLTGGIINIIAFGALLYGAMWIGELRGMKSEGRLNISFSDGTTVPEKTSALQGTTFSNGMTIRMRGEQ